jgi:hypothetical protein
MSASSMILPDSPHEQARKLAEREGISLNQLLVTALAEKMAALMTEEYLAEPAARGSRKKLDRVLGKAPANDPMEGDEMT